MGDSFMGSQEYDGYASSPSSSHQPEPRGQRPAQQPRAAVAAGAGAAAAAGGQPRDSRPHPTPAVAMAGTEHRRPAAAAAAAASAPLSQQPPQYDQLFGQEAAAAASAPAQPLQAEQRKRQALQVSSPPDAAEDLLGMHSTTGSRSVGAPSASSSAPPQPSQPATAAQQPEEDDLLGFSGGGAERAPSGGSHVQQPSSASSSTAHIDSLFAVPAPAVPLSSGGGRSGGRPGGASAGGGGSRPAAGSSSGKGAGLDSMIDLGGGLPAVDTAGFAALYQDDQVGLLLRVVGWGQPALLVVPRRTQNPLPLCTQLSQNCGCWFTHQGAQQKSDRTLCSANMLVACLWHACHTNALLPHCNCIAGHSWLKHSAHACRRAALTAAMSPRCGARCGSAVCKQRTSA